MLGTIILKWIKMMLEIISSSCISLLKILWNVACKISVFCNWIYILLICLFIVSVFMMPIWKIFWIIFTQRVGYHLQVRVRRVKQCLTPIRRAIRWKPNGKIRNKILNNFFPPLYATKLLLWLFDRKSWIRHHVLCVVANVSIVISTFFM